MKLNSILKSFHKTLDQLDRYIETTNQQIEKNEQRLMELHADNFQCHQDIKKAAHARGQVAKLIDPDE